MLAALSAAARALPPAARLRPPPAPLLARRSPSEALSTALYLNDKYQLDGRDPNGYVGCMWSIAGVHDQVRPPQQQERGRSQPPVCAQPATPAAAHPSGLAPHTWPACLLLLLLQGWGERPVFGKIRYMNYAGCKRKFDIPKYVAYVNREVAAARTAAGGGGSAGTQPPVAPVFAAAAAAAASSKRKAKK